MNHEAMGSKSGNGVKKTVSGKMELDLPYGLTVSGKVSDDSHRGTPGPSENLYEKRRRSEQRKPGIA